MVATKVPINEAAQRLGISLDVARKRVKRGTLPAEKVDGRWYVELDGLDSALAGASQPGDTAASVQPTTSQLADQLDELAEASHAASQGLATLEEAKQAGRQEMEAELTALRDHVVSLRDEVGFLRSELETRAEELRRKDILLSEFARRPLELPAPAPSPPPRPWWKFWLS